MAEESAKKLTIKIPRINPWSVTTFICAAILVLMFVGVIPTSITGGFSGLPSGSLSGEEAANKAVDYINSNLVAGGGVSLVSVEESSGVYKVITSYQGNDIDVYVTKDGVWLFVTPPFDTTTPITTTTTTTQPQITCEDVTKSDKAELDAFVVSYCPFGLQMQRILSEIVKNIPALAENIKIRYMGWTGEGDSCEYGVCAMHGKEEAAENLRQICIREEQADKYWDYVACFMKGEGKTEECLAEVGVDVAQLNECMTDSSRGVEYAKVDFDLQDQYQVTGSPTLILNGERVSEFDFGGRTAEAVKSLLCCGFSTEPTSCDQQLNTAQAATSFSESYASSSGSSGGSC